MKPIEVMYEKIKKMTNRDIQIVWDALDHYDPKENYLPGISMDTWANAIYSEMDRRDMPHLKSSMEFMNDEKITELSKPVIAPLTEHQAMLQRVEKLSDHELEKIWERIDDYKSGLLYAPNIQISMWKTAISIEMDKRGISRIRI